MTKRTRKKWLKKHNKYISFNDLWNLDCTMSEFILPRLKEFKRVNFAYPGYGEMDTPEKWDDALDKMIHSFELTLTDPVDLYDIYNHDLFVKQAKQYEREVQEGLQLFAKYYQYLWI